MKLLLLLIPALLAAQTGQFPAAVVTDAQLKIAANNISTKLAASAAVSDAVITVASAAGIIPNMLLSIGTEVMSVTAVNGQALTVSRGFDNSAAAAHSLSSVVTANWDAWHWNAARVELEAIEAALGPNLSNISTAPLGIGVYNFSETPGGTVTIGTNSETFSPCPLGLNGTDVNHYVWITGGAGSPEAALITGGTCTSGAGSGTVFFTAANTHSGAFTIGSSTGGIQESLQAAGTKGSVTLPAGTTQVWNTVYFTAPYQSLGGTGRYSSYLQANFNSGNIIVDDFNYTSLRNFGVLRQNGYTVAPTSGATIGIFGAAYVQLDNLYLRHSFNAIDTLGTCVSGGALGNCSLVFANNIILEAVANEGIIGLQGTLSNLYFNANLPAGYTATYTPQDFLEIQFADGTQVSNVIWGGAYSRSTVYFNVPACTSCRAGLLSFSNMQTDGWIGGPAILFGGSTGFGANTLNFDNCDWSTSTGNANPVFRVNTELSNISITHSKFVNMQGKVFDGGGDGAGITNLTFSGNQLISIANGIPAISMNTFGIGVGIWTFANNNFYQGGGGTPTYDLEFLAAASFVQIVDNQFTAYSIGPINWAATPTTAVIGLNALIDNSPQVVASAASIALTPGFKNYIITGTTGIGAITGLYEGEEVKLLTNGGAVVFTSSGSIGNTITSTLNVPLLGTVISGKIYLK